MDEWIGLAVGAYIGLDRPTDVPTGHTQIETCSRIMSRSLNA